jgi:hypothetical protein
MSTETTSSVEITTGVTDTIVGSSSDTVSTDVHLPCIQEKEPIVDVVKHEYSIVGDAIFATVTGDVPYWLSVLVDNVVNQSIASGLSDYDQLTQDVRSAIDSIDTAANTYVEQIVLDQTIDNAISARLSVLNASYLTQFATKTELTTAVADRESAVVQDISDLAVSFNNTVDSRITTVETAFASADNALASSVNSITATLIGQAGEAAGNANAVTSLRSYVGLDPSFSPNGTALLSRVSILESQNDGVVEFITGNYDVMIGIEDPNNNTNNDQLDVTKEPYASWIAEDTNNGDSLSRSSHVGDVFVQATNVSGSNIYVRSYKFIKATPDSTSPYSTDTEGYTWAVISDSDAQQAYALATEAKDLADSKRRVFVVTPFAPYEIGDLWVDNSGPYRTIKTATAAQAVTYLLTDWVVADEQLGDFISSIYAPESAQIRRQLDGKQEHYYYESYTTIGGVDEAAALATVASLWNTQEIKDAHNGDTVYFKDSTNAYWYQASVNTWVSISDTSIYEALQNSAAAQAAADGKISQFYAWYSPLDNPPATVYEVDGATVAAIDSSFIFWFKTNNSLYYKPGASWVLYPNVSSGDVLNAFHSTTKDITIYTFNGASWQKASTAGIVASSESVTALNAEIQSGTGTWAIADSTLDQTLRAYTNDAATGVESKFAYNSTLNIDGQFHTAGFGLTTSGVTQPPGADGTTASTAFDSRFWVDAESFVVAGGNNTPTFSIDTASNEVVFNGRVTFNGAASTLEEVVSNANNYANTAASNATSGLATETFANTAASNAITGLATESYVGTSLASTLIGYATEIYANTTADSAVASALASYSVSYDSLSGKNVLAQQLGYSNYNALTSAAAGGSTLINGGFINTDVIEAGSISGGMIAATGIITNTAQINTGVIKTANVADANITGAKIKDAEIGTLKLAGQSVTHPVGYVIADAQVPLNGVRTILSATHNPGGGKLCVSLTSQVDGWDDGAMYVYIEIDNVRVQTTLVRFRVGGGLEVEYSCPVHIQVVVPATTANVNVKIQVQNANSHPYYRNNYAVITSLKR